jgi:hypothetical protein
MDFRILGPLEVCHGAAPVALGGDKQRAVLAILLLHPNEVVSADRLIDELWGESPPPGARRTLRAYVSKLRRAMAVKGASPGVDGDGEAEPAEGVVLTRGHGYLLEVAPGELDLDRLAAAPSNTVYGTPATTVLGHTVTLAEFAGYAALEWHSHAHDLAVSAGIDYYPKEMAPIKRALHRCIPSIPADRVSWARIVAGRVPW